jgi:hypothetical protein
MRIVGLLLSSKMVRVLFVIGSMGFAAGCDGGSSPAPPTTPADTQSKQDSERDARQKAYGKSGLPPGTKDAAAKAPKE